MASCVFAASAGEMPEKAERYRTMLLKKPENPTLFGRMLDAWLEQGELEGLKGELELRAKEGGAADWRLLAVFHEHGGDEAAALKALDQAIERAPEEPAARLARGKALGTALRFDEALKDLELAGKDPALAVEAGTLSGKYLARAGRPAEAVKAWQALIAAHPADQGLKEDLIDLVLGEGMLDEAVKAARELAAASGDPYQKALRSLRVAEILAQGGRKDDALKEYRTVFAVSAEGSWLEREVLARVAALYGREDDAAGLNGFLGELREAFPRRVMVKKEAAKSLLAAGQEEEAVAMFREVLKVLPGNREVREEFIGLLEGAGRNGDAAQEVTVLLESAKEDGALWERLANLRKVAGDAKGADEALAKAAALMPDDESGAVAEAALWERFGKTEESERVLREAMAKHGQEGEAAEALAGLLIARGKPEDAVAIWRAMAAKADREGLLRISRSLAAHGRSADAVGMLQPRMKDFPDDPLLLAALCQAAQLGEDAELAVPHALTLVRLAQTPSDFESAIRLAAAAVARSREPRKWLEELAAKPNPSLSERCLLSDLYEGTGDSIAAERVLKEAMAGDENLLAASQRVRLFEARGDARAAVTAMRELIALPGGMKTAHVKRLVELLERAGDEEGALAATQEWQRLAPGDKQVWTKRADLFEAAGQPAEAVGELRRALAKFGADEDLRAKLAGAQRDAGMQEEAWRSFMALHDEAESSASKLKWAVELARMAQTEGTEEELVKEFRRRSRDNPSSPQPLLALAEMYREWQNPDQEMECLAEAGRRRPEDTALALRIAELFEQQGQLDKAEAALRGLLGGPAAVDARRRLAAFWFKQGDTERGLREMLDGGGKTDPRALERMVMPLIVAKEWEQALKVLEPEVRVRPEDWRLGYLQAVVLLEAGRGDEALNRLVALLGASGQLKGATSPTGGIPTAATAAQPLPRRLSNGVRRWETIVRSYRGGEQRHYYGGMQAPGEVALPGTPAEVRSMALAQALMIARDDRGRREELLARIQSPEIDDLEPIKRLYFLDDAGLRSELAKPDASPEAFSWYCDNLAYNQTPDVDLLHHGIRICASRNPETAYHLASRLTGWSYGYSSISELRAEEAKLLLDRAANDDPNREGRMRFLSGVALGDEKMPEELRQRAEGMILAELERDSKSQWNGWLADALPLEWLRRGRVEEAAAWINRRQAEQAKRPAPNPDLQYLMRNFRSNGSATDFSLAQLMSAAAPANFQGILGNDESLDGRTVEIQRQLMKILGEKSTGVRNRMSPSAEFLAAAAAKLEDPHLRLLFFQAAGDERAVTAEIVKLAQSDDAVDLLLAAAWSLDQQKPADAYALLTKAAAAGPSGVWREAIDYQLVRTGAALAGGESKIELEPAQRAALRMRKAALDPESRAQLSKHLAKLGLEDEGRRLTAAPVSPPVRGAGRMSMGYRPPRVNATSRLPQMIREGKQEAAARLLLSELRRVENDPNRGHEAEQLYRAAANAKLQALIVKLDTPGEGASYLRRKESALCQVKLGAAKEALEALRQLAREKPDDGEVKVALFSGLPPAEQEAQIGELAKSGFSADGLADFFEQWLRAEDVERYFAGLTALASYLEALPPDFSGKRNLSWVNYQAKLALDGVPFSRSLRSLVGERQVENPDKELSDRREALLGRWFRAMLRHPQTAEQGFMLLHLARETLGVSAEELDRAALAAKRAAFRLEAVGDSQQPSYRGPGYRWAKISANGSSTSSGSPAGGLTPDGYLTQRMAEGAQLEIYDEAFVAEVKKAGGARAELYERISKVTSSPGLAEFERWKAALGEDQLTIGDEIPRLAELARIKGRKDLIPACENLLCELSTAAKPSSYRAVVALGELVLAIPTVTEKSAAVDRICRRLLGPEEAWPLYVEVGRRIYLPSITGRLNAFQSFVQSLSEDLPAAGAATRFVGGAGLAPLAGLGNGFLYSVGIRDETWPAALLASGILASGPEPAGIVDSQGTTSLIEMVVGMLQRRSDIKLDVLQKAEGDARFWARLTAAAVSADTAVAVGELDRAAGAVSQWKPAERQRLAKLVLRYFPDAPEKAKGATRKMLLENQSKGREESIAKAERFLKDGLPADFQPGSSDNPVQAVVLELVGSDPALAAKVWAKGLVEMRSKSTSWSSQSNGYFLPPDAYMHDRLLQNLRQKRLGLMEMVAFVAELELLPEARPSLNGRLDGSFQYSVRQAFDDELEKFKKEKGKAAEVGERVGEETKRYLGCVAKLAEEAPKRGREAFAALALVDLLQHGGRLGDQNGRKAVIEWTESQLRKRQPLLADVLIIGALAPDRETLAEAERGRLSRALEAFAESAAVPGSWKMMGLTLTTPTLRAKKLDAACVNALAEAATGYIVPERAWASEGLIRFLTDLSKLPELSDEAAAKLLAAMVAAPVNFAASGGSGGEAKAAVATLELNLHLRGGDGAKIAKAVQAGGPELRGRADLILQLWRLDQGKAARELLPRPNEFHRQLAEWLGQVSESENGVNLPRFDKATEAALPGWLKTIDDPGQRYRLECLVSSLADAEGAEAPASKRDDRLVALQPRFAAEAPQARAGRLETLAMLIKAAPAAEKLHAEVAEATKGLDGGRVVFLRLQHSNSPTPAPELLDEAAVVEALVRRRIRNELEATGDPTEFAKQLETILGGTTDESEWIARQFIGRFLPHHSALLLRKLAELPAGERSARTAAVRRIAAACLATDDNYCQYATVALTIAAHALSGEGKLLDQWLDELPAPAKDAWDRSRRNYGLRNNFALLTTDPLTEAGAEPARHELLRALLSEPATLQREIKHPTDLSSLIDSGLFSREDLFAVLDALPEDHPRRAVFLAEKAGIIGWRSNDAEAALKSYAAATEAAKAKGDPRDMAYVASYHAQYLNGRRGDKAGALAIARTIDVNQLDKREREWIEEMLKRGDEKK